MVTHPADRHLEIEAKLWVEALPPVLAKLAQAGAEMRHPRIFERNIRYEDASGSLTPAGVVLRLRQDDRARLTYKGPALVPATTGLQTRFEAEVTVDDFDTMALILERLGYRPFMVYEKYRTTYVLDETEIVLDEMPYGLFVEIEGAPDRIEAVIDRLGLADAPRFGESYAQLFERVKHRLGLTFTDLTFENFSGIRVPLEAFLPEEKAENHG
ncbi:MAG: hypothetical protein Kow0077_03420 [Anaerolineae bacterium]